MARPISQTLTRSFHSFSFLLSSSSSKAAATTRNGVSLISSSSRNHSTWRSESTTHASFLTELEALTVRNIEDAIHGIIVKRSTPDWLPFLPGSSYWVPPRPINYGVAEIVHKLGVSNSLSDEKVMSLTTSFGWPSADFYAPQDATSPQTVAESSDSATLSGDDES